MAAGAFGDYKQRVGTICFNEDKSEVLLINSTKHEGRWVLPGGKFAPEEDVRAAALRETSDEAGATVEITEDLGTYVDEERKAVTRMFAARVTALLAEDAYLDGAEKGRSRRWFPARDAIAELSARPGFQRLLQSLVVGDVTRGALEEAAEA